MLGSPLARGRTAELYAWKNGHVLKLFYAWCPRDLIDRELNVNRQLAGTGLPIPRLLDVVEIEGRSGLAFERVEGPTILQVMSRRPWRVARLAHLLADLHTAVHQISVTNLIDVRAYLRMAVDATDELGGAPKAAILRRLDLLPDRDRLCHFDFHPDQVMLSQRGPMIIDWMTAHRGPPEADVARSAIILSMGRAPFPSRFQRVPFAVGQGLYCRLYLRRYLALNPHIDETKIRAWMLPVAAGRLREQIENEQVQLLTFISSELKRSTLVANGGAPSYARDRVRRWISGKAL